MVNHAAFSHLLLPDSLRSAATGAGWSETYDCFLLSAHLYSSPLRHHSPNGFIFSLQLSHFLTPLYIPHSSFLLSSSSHLLHFPPFHFSSSSSSVRHFVLSTLSDLGVPLSDPDSLARLISSFLHSHHHLAISSPVPLYISFTCTTLLRDHAEAADWLHRGTPDSHVLRTLRATGDVLRRLKDQSFDASSLTLEDESCCTVCLEDFAKPDGGAVSRLPCSHVFHYGCVSQWLKFDYRCPVCRSPLPWVQALFPQSSSPSLPLAATTSSTDYRHDLDDNGHDDHDPAPGVLDKVGFFLKNVVKNMLSLN